MRSFSDLSRETDRQLLDIELYRTFGIERLFQMLSEKKLTLLEPSKWEDPYERALQALVTGDNPDIKRGLFGLCWTTEARSDALWRIYSPNKLGVRISTTVGRLYSTLERNTTTHINPNNLFLGRVTYLPEPTSRRQPFEFGKFPLGLVAGDFRRPIIGIADAIEDMAEAANSPGGMEPRNIAKALFLKRTPFNHEKEVRLLYVDHDTNGTKAEHTNGLLKLDINPLALIRGIQFDPRIDDDIYEGMRASVRAVLGKSKIRISKSSLYKEPREILAKRKQ